MSVGDCRGGSRNREKRGFSNTWNVWMNEERGCSKVPKHNMQKHTLALQCFEFLTWGSGTWKGLKTTLRRWCCNRIKNSYSTFHWCLRVQDWDTSTEKKKNIFVNVIATANKREYKVTLTVCWKELKRRGDFAWPWVAQKMLKHKVSFNFFWFL